MDLIEIDVDQRTCIVRLTEDELGMLRGCIVETKQALDDGEIHTLVGYHVVEIDALYKVLKGIEFPHLPQT